MNIKVNFPGHITHGRTLPGNAIVMKVGFGPVPCWEVEYEGETYVIPKDSAREITKP